MIYIKLIGDEGVQLGGQVATEEMLADGWFEYEGPIPSGEHLRLVDGVLEPYEPEVPLLTQIQIYKEYLTKTDHKMYIDYEPKAGEDVDAIRAARKTARDFIRANTLVISSAPDMSI